MGTRRALPTKRGRLLKLIFLLIAVFVIFLIRVHRRIGVNDFLIITVEEIEMDSEIKLRLRFADGMRIFSIPSKSSLIELLGVIEGISGVAIGRQDLRIGYPPRLLQFDSNDFTKNALDFGLSSGEQIILNDKGGDSAGSDVRAHIETGNSISKTPVTPPTRSPDGHSVELNTGDGYLILRVVPDDNSCLFSAISLALLGSIDENYMMRGIVANTIQSDPETYNESFLGHNPAEYVEAITRPENWGGAIELSILSHAFKTCIISVDIATLRNDVYNEEYENRIFVMYSGIHYDALSIAPSPDASVEFHTTVLPSFTAPPDLPDPLLEACKQLASELRQKRYYTDTVSALCFYYPHSPHIQSSFTLKCGDCGQALEGEKMATAHAKSTGHSSFSEY
ncbi:hypothetical protein E3P81_02845 [Wallemia ichthyophaga]|uniref:Ubiquitin thioesterase OTU n=1 Tax=Wallemia ichthyophaga TaxID=245174 RepID=A0A4T0J4N2_WALIC|nr:hypothetical protein E3P85_03078 [Wallemia ichthyophaga]TIB37378.1 hypothetical protein E3P86_02206 [Wallemia ichthyophaga]TIB48641.1 hypothetical protein E3P81_02845 [Wallemia ichthyophaga]TIB57717.1 hypothetical protein E3P79_02845 [Wallemia ichthyophaga]